MCKYENVFADDLGKVQGVKAKIYVDEKVVPLYFKPRPVAYALHDGVETKLDRLVHEDILEPVEFFEWATPIVPIVKSDGKSIRICGDYKVTINRVAKLDNYPIPKTEDLLATRGGGVEFTKLDLSQAYEQLELELSCLQSSSIWCLFGTWNFSAYHGKFGLGHTWRNCKGR